LHSITLQSHVGSDGVLKLQVPVGIKDVDLEVVLIVQPLSNSTERARQPWPAGFFEQTFGSLRDMPLVREPQGEYEQREDVL